MSNKSKIIALLLLGMGLVLLAVAFLTGQQNQGNRQVIQQELERVPVVVAVQRIPFGTEIKPEMLRVDKVPLAPAGAYQSIVDLQDRKPLYTIEAGIPITKAYFEPGAVASQLRDGHRAFALSLDDNNVTTAKIKAGDYVDVFSIFKAKDNEVDQTISRLILPKLRVLSVGDSLVNSPDAAKEEKPNPNAQGNRVRRADKAVTVEVAMVDVNTLALAQTQGELFVVIRSPDDEGMPDTTLYPQADAVLKPLKASKDGKAVPTTTPAEPLTPDTQAYAGTAVRDVVIPGSAKKPAPLTRQGVAQPIMTRPKDPREEAVEVIRAGEISKEKAR